jgi:hypothetical protein
VARQYITADEYRARYVGSPQQGAKYNDAILETYIEIATANVEAFCERIFSEEEYTEVFRGDGSTTHLVYEYPIIDVATLTEATVETTSVTTTYDIDRLIRTTRNDSVGRIELDGLDDNITSFSPLSLYTLEYTGGFTELPVAVKHATALWVSELMRPDYFPSDGRSPEVIPLTSEQIAELLIPLRRRRISGV